jgi:hypothetical protein
LKKEPEEPRNPFEDFSFWLWLAAMDFSIWFGGITENESSEKADGTKGNSDENERALCNHGAEIGLGTKEYELIKL